MAVASQVGHVFVLVFDAFQIIVAVDHCLLSAASVHHGRM
jgi:hypothetical protein